MRGQACRRFGRILNEIADRDATASESAFLARHRAACAMCRRQEDAAALSLDLLRGCALDAQVEDSFDRRVLRRARAQRVQDGFRYWSPAFFGALVASCLLLATVQALARPIDPSAPRDARASRSVDGSLALKDVPFLKSRPAR